MSNGKGGRESIVLNDSTGRDCLTNFTKVSQAKCTTGLGVTTQVFSSQEDRGIVTHHATFLTGHEAKMLPTTEASQGLCGRL